MSEELWTVGISPDDYPSIEGPHGTICPSVDTVEHAILIALAPKLLAALDAIEKLMTMDGYEPGHFGGDKLLAARAVIAKARGQT